MAFQNATPKNWIQRFVGRIYGIIRGYFALIGLLVTIAGVAWSFAIYKMIHVSESKESAESDSWVSQGNPLRLKLVFKGRVTSRSRSLGTLFLSSFGQPDTTIYLPELRATLLKAKTDPKIAGLNMVIHELLGSSADMVELRRILSDFRKDGKRIHCVLNEPNQWNYYIASISNYITMNPASSLELSGPAFTLVYFAEGLKKLGIQMEVVKAGKYKSAFEPFVTNEPSEATKEQYESMRTRLADHLVQYIAEGRQKSPDVVHGWLKESIFTADEALKRGIIDRVGYEDETNPEPFVKGQKVMVPSPTDPAQVSSPNPTQDEPNQKEAGPADREDKWISYSRYESLNSKNSVKLAPTTETEVGMALIEAQGEITMNREENVFGEDTGISPEHLIKRLRWAGETPEVKSVIFKINSPGGSAVASDIIWNEVRHLASQKPVVVYMGAVAASGGYYIAAPANYIVAEPTTITGSIGVIGMVPKVKESREKYGISFHLLSGSDRKTLMNPGVSLSEEDRKILESTIDSTYQTFLNKVAAGRKLPLDQVADLAQGRVYTGMEAREIGLVDDLGGYQAAVRQAKILGGLDPERLYPLHRYSDDDLDLKGCFTNPLRCLNPGTDSRMTSQWQGLIALVSNLMNQSFSKGFGADLFQMADWSPEVMERSILRIGRWLESKPLSFEPLALWPDQVVVH